VYLGMTLEYQVCRQVKITMFKHINEIRTAFDKGEPNGAGTKTSAATENLFTVNNCEELSVNKAF